MLVRLGRPRLGLLAAPRDLVWAAALPLATAVLVTALACASTSSVTAGPSYAAQLQSADSTVAGTAAIEPEANGYHVAVSVGGLPAGAYTAHLQQGGCGDALAETAAIGTLFSDGVTESRLDAPAPRGVSELESGWSVGVWAQGDDSASTPIACGDLAVGGS